MTETKVTKENAPKPPGIYTNDDGSQTLIGPDGKEIKNPYADLYLNPNNISIYHKVIKPALNYLKDADYKELAKKAAIAALDPTGARRKVIKDSLTSLKDVGNFIRDENERMQMQRDDKLIIWSEKHNKYMSKYELKLQEAIDAKHDMENNGGQL